jgi:TnpA family transposase
MFYPVGKICDHSFENQRHSASGLNLLVAAITSSADLLRAFGQVRANGGFVVSEYRRHKKHRRGI